MGNEGSSQWIAVMALNHMSKWVDGSVPKTKLVENMIKYFHGFDSDKLIECSRSLRRNQIKPEIASLVYSAANDGDGAATAILRRGAKELFRVARDVVRKLGFENEPAFLSGMWGSVFHDAPIFAAEYARLFSREYPNSSLIRQQIDRADSAALMALDYLNGGLPFIAEL
jgi:N-acetylglucosamine kinase-like BadF-type ATPase